MWNGEIPEWQNKLLFWSYLTTIMSISLELLLGRRLSPVRISTDLNWWLGHAVLSSWSMHFMSCMLRQTTTWHLSCPCDLNCFYAAKTIGRLTCWLMVNGEMNLFMNIKGIYYQKDVWRLNGHNLFSQNRLECSFKGQQQMILLVQ